MKLDENQKNSLALAALFISLILVFSLIVGCAGKQSIEIAAGQSILKSEDWRGGPSARFTFRNEFDDRRFCDLTHVSHIFTGPPFNDELETWYNEVSCGMRFNLN